MAETKSPFLPTFAVPMLAALLGILFARSLDGPTQPARPTARAAAPAPDSKQVDALLTHDPFQRVLDRELPATGMDASPLRGMLASTGSPSEGRSLVLAVLLRGGPWPEDRDRRIDARIAVVQAIMQSGFAVERPRHLRFFESACAPTLTVPFDTFTVIPDHVNDARYVRVVALWLDETVLLADPIGQTRALADELDLLENAAVDLRVVGPTTSGGLERWIESSHRERSSCPPLELYSPYATVPTSRLQEPDTTQLRITRTIGTDDLLARLILLELRERIPSLMRLAEPVAKADKGAATVAAHDAVNEVDDGVDYKVERQRSTPFGWNFGFLRLARKAMEGAKFLQGLDRSPRVALIVEEDSLYGRNWIRNLEEARELLSRRSDKFTRLQFEQYPYVTIVDGAGLTDPQDPVDVSPASSQLDFIARYADSIEASGGADAIGILGTDTYDILQILGTLRSRFPSAVFFTTDMDAQFLAPEHLPYARNLVVASHLGLGVPSGVPMAGSSGAGELVFRDTYQHNVYRTTKSLVCTGSVPAWNRKTQPPHLYEIGRGRAINLDLNGFEPNDEASPRSTLAAAFPWISPAALDSVLVGAVALLALGLAARLFVGWGDWRILRGRAGLPAIALVVVVGCSLFRNEVAAAGVLPVPPSLLGPALAVSALVLTIAVLCPRHFGAGVASLALFLLCLHDPVEKVVGGFGRSSVRRLVIGGVLFVCLLAIVGHRPGRFSKEEPKRRVKTITMLALVAALAAMVLLRLYLGLEEAAVFAAMEPTEALLGVSAWPAVLLRIAGIATCWIGFVRIREGMIAQHDRLGREYLLEPGVDRKRGMPWGWLFSIPTLDPTARQPLDSIWSSLGQAARKRLWLARIIGYVFAYIYCLGPLFERNPIYSPVRGEVAYLCERASIFLLVLSFFFLFFFVLESSFLCQRIVLRVLDSEAAELPEALIERESRATGLRPAPLQLRIRLHLAEEITRHCDHMVLWPIGVVALMILSRASLFDRWTWPLILVGTFLTFFVLLVLCAWNNRRAAQNARERALRAIQDRVLHHAGDLAEAQRLRALREEIEGLRLGAFSPFLQQPILRSLAWPGVAALLSLLAAKGWISV